MYVSIDTSKSIDHRTLIPNVLNNVSHKWVEEKQVNLTLLVTFLKKSLHFPKMYRTKLTKSKFASRKACKSCLLATSEVFSMNRRLGNR